MISTISMVRVLVIAAVLQLGTAPSSVMTAKVPQPIKTNLEIDVQSCREQGGEVLLGPRYMQEGDLDGDGRPDYLIDQEAVRCTTAASLYCGNSPCPVFAYLAVDGYREPHFLPGDVFEPTLVPQGSGSAVETAGVDTNGSATRVRWVWRDGTWRSATLRRAN